VNDSNRKHKKCKCHFLSWLGTSGTRLNHDAGMPPADYRKKCRCRTNFSPAFRHFHMIFQYHIARITPSAAVCGCAGFLPFHRQQFGHEGVSPSKARSVDMQGASLSTASSMDVQGALLSKPEVWTCRLYPFQLPAVWRCSAECILLASSMDMQGVSPFHLQQYGHAGCIPFHCQQSFACLVDV
jgi:hypothetical protein